MHIARIQHVQCSSQINFLYSVMTPLSSCTNVSSSVSLALRFHKLGGPHVYKVFPSGTCCLCRSAPATTMARVHPLMQSAHELLAVSAQWFVLTLELKRCANWVHVSCTCNVHPMPAFRSVVMHLPMCTSLRILVSPAQKLTNPEDPPHKKFPLL